MAYISIDRVSKQFCEAGGRSVEVLRDVTLEVEKGELVSIFGPNACGKTTLLNMIAGLTTLDQGSILIDSRRPRESKIGLVFQDYSDSLFPWMKNVDNIAFSLDPSWVGRKRKRQRIRDYVASIGLQELPLDKYPYQCSGGQQQLVALVRELAYDPDVLLLDEPFASLDYDRRMAQQEQLLETWHKTQTTILLVSHELDEALLLADRLVLLSQRPASIAKVYQIDLPRPRAIEMYETEAFFHLRAQVLRKFREIIGK